MKLSTVFCLAVCITSIYCETPFTPRDLIPYMEDCATKNQVDRKTIDDIIKNKSFSLSPRTECYAECLMKSSGMVNEDGSVSQLFNTIPKASNCNDISGTNSCETAAKRLNCLLDVHDE